MDAENQNAAAVIRQLQSFQSDEELQKIKKVF